jgi:hypothetical protein
MLITTKDEFVHFVTSRKPPYPRKIGEALEWNRTPIQGTQRGDGRGNLARPLKSLMGLVALNRLNLL